MLVLYFSVIIFFLDVKYMSRPKDGPTGIGYPSPEDKYEEDTFYDNNGFVARKVYYKKLVSMVERYNMRENVIFLSNFKEMPVIYYISDVVVSSSIEPEAFGRVSVEAQSMEIPIVASDIGGSKETIVENETGYLYKNNDTVDLANKINEVMKKNYNSLKSVGIKGRKNVLKKFDVDKMCQTTFTEYKKLIELS